jgi:hypothetical protein
VVGIRGSVYVPVQSPQLLQEMFDRIVEKARLILNPVEAAFFLWVNIAYLQPFEDGNKRVSRLAANVPLLLRNHAPLSFLGVSREDYALAMMGVYELGDVSLAVDLFSWTYRRSLAKYEVILKAMDAPDPFRIRNRQALTEAVQMVVMDRLSASKAASQVLVATQDLERFHQMLRVELASLEQFNCARFRLGMQAVQAWIDAGRPSCVAHPHHTPEPQESL